MSHRQPFKSTLPSSVQTSEAITNHNSQSPTQQAQNSNMLSPTAPNQSPKSQLTDSTMPVLNLSGLRKPKTKNATATERVSSPHSPRQTTSSSFSTSLINTLVRPSSSLATAHARHTTPTFAMPAPLSHAAQNSPAFLLAGHTSFNHGTRSEGTRTPAHAPHPKLLSNRLPNDTAIVNTLLGPPNPTSIPHNAHLRSFSRASQHVDPNASAGATMKSNNLMIDENDIAMGGNPSDSWQGMLLDHEHGGHTTTGVGDGGQYEHHGYLEDRMRTLSHLEAVYSHGSVGGKRRGTEEGRYEAHNAHDEATSMSSGGSHKRLRLSGPDDQVCNSKAKNSPALDPFSYTAELRIIA